MVDHINGIRTDNRLENLRWVTRSQNAANRHYEKADERTLLERKLHKKAYNKQYRQEHKHEIAEK